MAKVLGVCVGCLVAAVAVATPPPDGGSTTTGSGKPTVSATQTTAAGSHARTAVSSPTGKAAARSDRRRKPR